MAKRFYGGVIYQGLGTYLDELFVDDMGLVCNQTIYQESLSQEEINLAGKMLVPAFRDTHSHPLFAGREAQGLDISSFHSITELGQALRSHRSDNPDLAWLDASVYDRSIPGEQTRQTLDAYVSDIPVVLHADDHHTLWVNTKALEVAGLLTATLPELSAGRFDVDGEGIPTGILREWPAMSIVMDLAPANTLQEDVQALIFAEQRLISEGIVECQDAWIDRGMAEVYLEATRLGLLKLDYKLAFRADVETFTNDLDYFLDLRDKLNQTSNLKGQAIKFFVDGVFGSATASVSDPYLSTNGFGELNWSMKELVEAISTTHRNHLQVHIHAIGDAGVDFALEAISQAEQGSISPVIAHAELTNDQLLSKAKDLAVNLCMQPYWAQNNGMLDSCRDHLGEARLESLYAIKDMIAAGLNVAFSSDWPVSTPSVLSGITVAVHRRESTDMVEHNPEQAISLEEALDAYSAAACKLLGNVEIGTLAIGQSFDAVIVNKNLKEEDLDGFRSAKVFATYKAGNNLLV